MTSRRVELHASAAVVAGLALTLLFTACGEDGGEGAPAAGGSASMASGGMGTGASSGGSGAVSSTGGSTSATGGAAGAGGGPVAGGASSSGGSGAGGVASGGATSGGAPVGGSGGNATGGAGGASGGTGGVSAGGTGGGGATGDACKVSSIPADVRSRYQNMNDPYYTKYATTSGGVVAASGALVDDAALVRYCRLLEEMFSNASVRQPVLASKMWFTMIGQEEQLSSLPQINKQYGTSLNARARGLGGLTPTICAEDSIMCMPGDKWVNDCICAHETGHTLYSSGIAKVPELSRRLTEITSAARSSGRLANAYVWQDGNESGMMSWGVQAWYNCAINGTRGAYHTDINTRAELLSELPEFHRFLSELLPADNVYKDCYAKQ